MPKPKFYFSVHLQKQAAEKGIPLDKIQRVLNTATPYPARYFDQYRYVGDGIAVIADSSGKVITVYLDRVFTPLRPDQIARGEQIRRTK